MSPAGWIGRCLLILGMGGTRASEILFAPASGKLEFVQEGVVFNSRQHADLVFQISRGPELRTLLEITHHVRRHVSGLGSMKGGRGLEGPDHQANRVPQEGQQSYSGAAFGSPCKETSCPTTGPSGAYSWDPRDSTPDSTSPMNAFSNQVHQRLQSCAEQVVKHLNKFHQTQQTRPATARPSSGGSHPLSQRPESDDLTQGDGVLQGTGTTVRHSVAVEHVVRLPGT